MVILEGVHDYDEACYGLWKSIYRIKVVPESEADISG